MKRQRLHLVNLKGLTLESFNLSTLVLRVSHPYGSATPISPSSSMSSVSCKSMRQCHFHFEVSSSLPRHYLWSLWLQVTPTCPSSSPSTASTLSSLVEVELCLCIVNLHSLRWCDLSFLYLIKFSQLPTLVYFYFPHKTFYTNIHLSFKLIEICILPLELSL